MIHGRDPARMAQAERIQEIGELLALGWRRLAIRTANELAALADRAQSCDHAVDDREKDEVA